MTHQLLKLFMYDPRAHIHSLEGNASLQHFQPLNWQKRVTIATLMRHGTTHSSVKPAGRRVDEAA